MITKSQGNPWDGTSIPPLWHGSHNGMEKIQGKTALVILTDETKITNREERALVNIVMMTRISGLTYILDGHL